MSRVQKRKNELERIIFVGRTYEEYMQMFDLGLQELVGKNILDCPAGACSFTAIGSGKGLNITACDIAYDHPIDDLEHKGLQDTEHAIQTMERAKDIFLWDFYENVQGLGKHRHQALYDCVKNMREEPDRYIAATLPVLPFEDGQFDLVLSAHFLFMYGDRLDYGFHCDALRELLRVTTDELRIFPLVDLSGSRYEYLDQIIAELKTEGLQIEERRVPYEFFRNANSTLCIRKQ